MSLTKPLGCKCPHCHGLDTHQVALFDAAGERFWLAECKECKRMGKPEHWHSERPKAYAELLASDLDLTRQASVLRRRWLATERNTPECDRAFDNFSRAWARCAYLAPCLAAATPADPQEQAA